MNLKSSRPRPASRLDLLDTLMDSYVNWRDNSRAVDESYRRWAVSTGGERGVAFDQYLAALDREEHAACGYEHEVEQARSRGTRA